MKIVILGNMGYVGSVLTSHLRNRYPNANLVGFDTGFYAGIFTQANYLPERRLDRQYFGDIRDFPESILQDADAVINLAAISNDPMGSHFEKVTMAINYEACIRVARKAKQLGVRTFVFASSCSMYGAASGKAKTENSNVDPLTAYALSKVYAERDLRPLADDNFKITCLRFSTACGISPRLRLDLVLNDFVACALTTKRITVLSDGTPWRSLINVKDMALAIEWAIGRPASIGAFLAINTGSESWNYQIKQLAETVASIIPDVEVSINPDAPADKRSYVVDFSLYRTLAPHHQPQCDLLSTINELTEGLEAMSFRDSNFRNSTFMRLNVLTRLQHKELLTEDLKWNFESQPEMIEK
jgi:nucleoside-diphosphate-sugar epimerase